MRSRFCHTEHIKNSLGISEIKKKNRKIMHSVKLLINKTSQKGVRTVCKHFFFPFKKIDAFFLIEKVNVQDNKSIQTKTKKKLKSKTPFLTMFYTNQALSQLN